MNAFDDELSKSIRMSEKVNPYKGHPDLTNHNETNTELSTINSVCVDGFAIIGSPKQANTPKQAVRRNVSVKDF